MNDPSMSEGLDPRLEAMFRQQDTPIPGEPCVGETLKRVAADWAKIDKFRRVVRWSALLAIIVASPWLIEASAFVSAGIDQALPLMSSWLETPAGMAIVLIVGAVLTVIFRRRMHR